MTLSADEAITTYSREAAIGGSRPLLATALMPGDCRVSPGNGKSASDVAREIARARLESE